MKFRLWTPGGIMVFKGQDYWYIDAVKCDDGMDENIVPKALKSVVACLPLEVDE